MACAVNVSGNSSPSCMSKVSHISVLTTMSGNQGMCRSGILPFYCLGIYICDFKGPFGFLATFIGCLGLDGVEVTGGAKFDDVSSKLYLLPVSNELRYILCHPC